MNISEKPWDHKRSLYMNVGFIASITFVILAFEWKVIDEVPIITEVDLSDTGDEFMAVKMHKAERIRPPAPKPKSEPVKEQVKNLNAIIVEVDDVIESFDDFELDDSAIESVVVDDGLVDEVADNMTHLIVDKMPQFDGGTKAFLEYIGKHIHYPSDARRRGIEGNVVIEFIIDKDGSISDAKILKGFWNSCDEEAIRVLKASPKWSPGKQRGRPVKVKMVVPITFTLGK